METRSVHSKIKFKDQLENPLELEEGNGRFSTKSKIEGKKNYMSKEFETNQQQSLVFVLAMSRLHED